MGNTKLLIESDRVRLPDGRLPLFQYFLRKTGTRFVLFRAIYLVLYKYFTSKRSIEIPWKTKIGYGFYIGHAYNITINSHTIIGNNCNIHRGVLLGMENRGKRKGTPIIGDNVWIGINACVVGNVRIGNDVLIAPNSYVNCDVPSHSVVFGNPCIIKKKDNATEGYINNVYIL